MMKYGDIDFKLELKCSWGDDDVLGKSVGGRENQPSEKCPNYSVLAHVQGSS